MSLEVQPPYDFDSALGYLRRSPSAILEEIGVDTYRRALSLDGRDFLVTLRDVGTIDAPKMELEITGRDPSDDDVAAFEARVRRIFSLDADPEPFLQVAQGDPTLVRLVERFPGLRPVYIADPYQALLWAIIGQQINVSFARKLKTALVDLCGRSFLTYPLLPSPPEVAALDPEMLRASQFSRQKIAYVLGVSEAIASGELDLDSLRAQPFEDAMAILTSYRGIGRWTAEYVLMRGLASEDSIPAGDLGLRAIIGRAYGLGRHATELEVRELAERWKPYRGWASFYWWMTLQAEGLGGVG